MAPTLEMLDIALKVKPNACCIVPEKREEVTTEGGIDVKKNHNLLHTIIPKLKQSGIKVSLFVDADEEQIIASKDIQADIVEIHAGEFCRKIENSHDFEDDLERIKKASQLADNLGLEVHIGHGITFDSIVELAKIPEVKEFNIGHFIIAEAIFSGLGETVSKLKVLIKENRGS
jgi:pyridoxine 5-phosphate synthase